MNGATARLSREIEKPATAATRDLFKQKMSIQKIACMRGEPE